jgi:hypothetical protein
MVTPTLVLMSILKVRVREDVDLGSLMLLEDLPTLASRRAGKAEHAAALRVRLERRIGQVVVVLAHQLKEAPVAMAQRLRSGPY